jgi:G3E family GTPase
MTRLPRFTVIGGYLGAGKTTLLNHLLSQAQGLRTAVLVNDFGEINIDAGLVAEHDGDTISLANGCICCSLTNGFAVAIAEVLKRADRLDHVIVEASGVAEPGKVAQYGQMYDLAIDGVLVVVDAEQVKAQSENVYVGDTVLRQLAQADLLVLNKTDLVSPPTLADVKSWLAKKGRGAPIFETKYSKVPLDILVGLNTCFRTPVWRFSASDPQYETVHQTWTLVRDYPIPRATIERFAAQLGKKVFRAKGFVCLSEAPDHHHLFQLVGRRWSLEDYGRCAPDAQTRLVVIGPPGSMKTSPNAHEAQ